MAEEDRGEHQYRRDEERDLSAAATPATFPIRALDFTFSLCDNQCG